jgi:hypothetical protein
MIAWLKRRRSRRTADAWKPPLGVGHWRTRYAECCDTLLAFDRLLATLPDNDLRRSLQPLRGQLVAALDRARALAEFGAYLEPAGPVRDPRVLDLLAEDPIENFGPQLGETGTGSLLREIIRIRTCLQAVADDVARLAARVHESPSDTDLAGWLDSLASGVTAACTAGWTPVGWDEE